MILRCCAPHKDPRSAETCSAVMNRVPDEWECVCIGIVRWIPEGDKCDGSLYVKCPKCNAVNKYRIVAPKNSIATKETSV